MTAVPVLFDDGQVIVADKPSGLLVHRSRESADAVALLQLLRDQVGCYLHPVHRLDRGASGCVVFARTAATARFYGARWDDPANVKEYLALVKGVPPPAGTIDRPLTDAKRQLQPALTSFRTLGPVGQGALVAVRLGTGRRHQIRRHLGGLGHQIIGDTTHGKGRINRLYREAWGLQRLFLHAWRLELPHPSGRRLVVRSRLPEQLRRIIEQLAGRTSFASWLDASSQAEVI